MAYPVFSIVFDKRQADKELTPLSVDRMLMALLVRRPPEPTWEGCLVFEGETPDDPATTKCIGTTGPGSDQVQERLVEALEGFNIRVLGVYEGGPEVRLKIATVKDGSWNEL
jgi:hypothetical protein